MLAAVLVGGTVLGASTAFGLGMDYPNGQPVINANWPPGVTNLVNTTNRIGGIWVNGRDWFFFFGSTSNFNAFLDDYSKIQGLEQHRLILHEGAGEAYTYWAAETGVLATGSWTARQSHGPTSTTQ